MYICLYRGTFSTSQLVDFIFVVVGYIAVTVKIDSCCVIPPPSLQLTLKHFTHLTLPKTPHTLLVYFRLGLAEGLKI